MKRMFLLLYLFVMSCIAVAMITTSIVQTRAYRHEILPAFLDYAVAIADSADREMRAGGVAEQEVLDRWLSEPGFGLSVMELVAATQSEPIVEQADISQLAESIVVLVPISEGRAIRVGYSDEYTPAFVRRSIATHLIVYFLLGLLIWWITRRGFEYFDRLGQRTQEIAQGEFGNLVKTPALPGFRELSNNVETMADLIAERYRAQAVFLGAAAHELRGPYTRMRLSLDMARESVLTQEHAGVKAMPLEKGCPAEQEVPSLLEGGQELSELLEELDAGLEDATELSDEMLALARISLAGEVPEHSTVAVRAFLESFIQSTNDSRLRLLAGQEVWVLATPVIVHHVLQNLIHNAQRHANDRIWIRIHPTQDKVQVTVEDDGNGLPVTNPDQLFDPFYSASNRRLNNSKGSGLGLAFAVQAMRVTGGKIFSENRAEGGARFVIEWRRVPDEYAPRQHLVAKPGSE